MEKKQDKKTAGTEHADERTQRRTGEAQQGGMSSQESAERYASGENPGGTHGGPGPQADPDGKKPNNYEDLGLKKDQG